MPSLYSLLFRLRKHISLGISIDSMWFKEACQFIHWTSMVYERDQKVRILTSWLSYVRRCVYVACGLCFDFLMKLKSAVHYSMPQTANLSQERCLWSNKSEYIILKPWHTVAPHQDESYRCLLNTKTIPTPLALTNILHCLHVKSIRKIITRDLYELVISILLGQQWTMNQCKPLKRALYDVFSP